MATIKAIEGRSVSHTRRNAPQGHPLTYASPDTPNPVWTSYRRPLLRCQRAGRE